MCAAWVVVGGRRVRRRTLLERQRYQERGGQCPYGCEPGECRLEVGPEPRAEAVIREWRLCGGLERRGVWPDGRSLRAQPAVTVLRFETIDQLMQARQDRGAHEERDHQAAG